MIFCSRCKREIKVVPEDLEYAGNLIYRIARHVPTISIIDRDILACAGCAQVFQDGIKKINEELDNIQKTMTTNWKNEWLHNKIAK